MPGVIFGGMIGMPRADLEARARMAAAKGDRTARMLLADLENTDRLSGRKRPPAITAETLSAWRCPACGAKGARASGRDGTVRCTQGHVRMADGRPAGILALLR